jgi:hypothetical protein
MTVAFACWNAPSESTSVPSQSKRIARMPADPTAAVGRSFGRLQTSEMAGPRC